jgi:hypothetical protein
MAWIYRLVQIEDGWACRFGRTEFDSHATLPAALTHIAALASAAGCDDIRMHHSDGTVEHLVAQQMGPPTP